MSASIGRPGLSATATAMIPIALVVHKCPIKEDARCALKNRARSKMNGFAQTLEKENADGRRSDGGIVEEDGKGELREGEERVETNVGVRAEDWRSRDVCTFTHEETDGEGLTNLRSSRDSKFYHGCGVT